MRILFTQSHPDRSEAAIFTALKNEGHNVHVALDPKAVRFQQIEETGVPVTPVRFRYKIDLPAISAVRKLIQSHRPDIIHTFNKRSLTNVLIAGRGFESRIIGYRGIMGNVHPFNPESRLIFFNKRLERIICVCHAVEKSLNTVGIPPGKTVTIHKGHDISWYKAAERSALSEWNIPANAFVIGCAARMRPRKGIDILLRALAEMKKPDVHLILAGEITDPNILRLVKSLALGRQVHAIGFRKDACALMGACDAFVMPSLRREGLPRAVIEAMAQETVPVVTDVGGMPELVRHAQDGLVVPPNNVSALAHALTHLSSSPAARLKLAASARQRIIDSFNIKSTVKQTLAVYDSVTAR